MSAELTLEEQEKILLVAEGLLREDASWTQRQWKCQLWDHENGEPACDDNGQQLYQYCIQGAVNQAAVDVLGEARARTFGLTPNRVDPNEQVRGEKVAAALGLDAVTACLYGRELGVDVKNLGDFENGTLSMAFNDSRFSTPEKIRTILRTRLKNVRRSLGRRKKA